MASLLKVIALAQILWTSVALTINHVEAVVPDCSAIIQKSNLGQYKDVCMFIDKFDNAYLGFELMNKLDILEQCTCNLLSHELVWQVMMTHEIESLFYSIRKLVSMKETKKEGEVVSRNNLMFENDHGDHMYFWDRFNNILRSSNRQDSSQELSRDLMEIFANNYYNPDSYIMPYKNNPLSMNLRRLLSTSCSQLLEQFGPFLTWFANLIKMSGNPRYVYRIVGYDQNLYKLMGAIKMCQFLNTSGELI